MSKVRAKCTDCGRKYRVPSASETYSCQHCEGEIVALGAGRAKSKPSSSGSRGEEAGQALPWTQRVLGFFGWKSDPPEDPDAVDPSSSLGAMDWDAFGAAPLEEDPTLEKPARSGRVAPEPSRSVAKPSGAKPSSASAAAPLPASQPPTPAASSMGSGSKYPPVPTEPTSKGSSGGTEPNVQSAFDDFDWD